MSIPSHDALLLAFRDSEKEHSECFKLLHIFCKDFSGQNAGRIGWLYFQTLGDFLRAAEAWVNFYNRERPHERLKYFSPNQFAEANHLQPLPCLPLFGYLTLPDIHPLHETGVYA